jgi:hypothetical protein
LGSAFAKVALRANSSAVDQIYKTKKVLLADFDAVVMEMA